GECWLRDERIAKMVRDALLHFQAQRYDLVAWCIMPNHVHAIVRPLGKHALSEILRSWKSFTAQRANRFLNREGKFWQPESYDHLIRNEQDFRNQVRYVLENPNKAGLKSWPWVDARSIGREPMDYRQDADATIAAAPGQLQSHYAPATPLRLIDNAETYSPPKNQRVGFLAWSGCVTSRAGFVAIRNLSARQDLREAATNLFRHLRELDALGLDLIV